MADLTNRPGAVTIAVDINAFSLPAGQSFKLLVDDNGTFSNAASYNGSVSNGVFTVNTPVDLPQGAYFTLAYTYAGATAPITVNYEPKQVALYYGSAFSTTAPLVDNGGSMVSSYSLLGNVPAGITINASSGIISVGNTTDTGNYPLSISARNAKGEAVFSNVLTIHILPVEAVAVSYNNQAVSLGNTIVPMLPAPLLTPGVFSYSLASGSLNGLLLNSLTGELSGTLSSEGTVNATVRITGNAPNATGVITTTVSFSAMGSTGPGGIGGSGTNKLWLDANQLTGLNDGDRLSAFLDYSGNGMNAQATATNRPTYRNNRINGKPAIVFDRTTAIQYMEINSSTTGQLMSNSHTIYAVAKANSGALNNGLENQQSIFTIPGFHTGFSFYNYPNTTHLLVSQWVGGVIPGTPLPSAVIGGNKAITQKTWYLASALANEVFSGTTHKGYVNSALSSSTFSNLLMTTYASNSVIRMGAAFTMVDPKLRTAFLEF